METFVGLDVSLGKPAFAFDKDGTRIFEGKVAFNRHLSPA